MCLQVIKLMRQFYLLLTIVVLNASLAESETYINFETFVDQFSRKYKDDAEYQMRKQVYEERILTYPSIKDYTPKVNNFTDWTEEELASLKTLLVLPPQAQSTSRASPVSSSLLGVPSHLDWRDRNVITSIKNQEQCGCCWSFASVAYAESRLIIQGKYKSDQIDLSEQFLLKCTKLSDCNGGYLEYAMNVVKNVPLEQIYPYDPYSGNSVDCQMQGIRTGYDSYNLYQQTDEQLINLLQVSPVPIAISSNGWQKYGSGVFKCAQFSSVDHAVLLIGYTPDYWIIKNQWGTTWGEDGFIRVTRDRDTNCQIGTAAHYLFGFFSAEFIGILIAFLTLFVL